MVHDTFLFSSFLSRIGTDYAKLATHPKKNVVDSGSYGSVADRSGVSRMVRECRGWFGSGMDCSGGVGSLNRRFYRDVFPLLSRGVAEGFGYVGR